MKSVLITGGAGFIGLNVARAFVADGVAVHLVDNFSRGNDDAELAALRTSSGVELIKLDLSAEGATDALGTSYDAILHFAAILGVAKVSGSPYETLTLNVMLTREALRLARRQTNLRAFVFASTSEIYAGSLLSGLLQFPTPEDSIIALPPLTAARTSYMLSKLFGEAMVHQAGVPSIIVRPHNVYGPRMGANHVVPELIKRMRMSKPGSVIRIFSPTHSRTFCYIDDAVELIKRLVSNPRAIGEVWNIGTEAPEYQMLEVAAIIRRLMGANLNLVGGEDTIGSPTRRCPSMARTNALTGLHERVSLEEGVARTLDWYQQNVLS
jgi:nucleoside-diphosphate-sugar epimerase